MKLPSFSIAILMAATAIAAVDCAVMGFIRADGTLSGDSALGVLPMASLLSLVGLHVLERAVRRRESHPFWVGFEVVGWMAVFLYMSGCLFIPRFAMDYLQTAMDLISSDGAPEWLDLMFIGALLSVPELLPALLGGWLTSRLRIAVVRLPDEPRDLAGGSP